MGLVAIVIIGLVLLAGGWVVARYNNLVMLSQRVKNAFAQIDVQLK